MIYPSKKIQLESLLSLDNALENQLVKKITNKRSEENITNNVVTVCKVRNIEKKPKGDYTISGRAGSGLKITSDGFVLTAFHVIENYLKEFKKVETPGSLKEKDIYKWAEFMKDKYCIRDINENRYAIDPGFLAYDASYDIALIKAITFERPKAIKFKVRENSLKIGENIKNLGKIDGDCYEGEGKILGFKDFSQVKGDHGNVEVYLDTFVTDAPSEPGFSGGPVIDENANFCGLISYLSENSDGTFLSTGASKFKHIRELVKDAVNTLKEHYSEIPIKDEINQREMFI